MRELRRGVAATCSFGVSVCVSGVGWSTWLGWRVRISCVLWMGLGERTVHACCLCEIGLAMLSEMVLGMVVALGVVLTLLEFGAWSLPGLSSRSVVWSSLLSSWTLQSSSFRLVLRLRLQQSLGSLCASRLY
jgi:hypothetical protein